MSVAILAQISIENLTMEQIVVGQLQGAIDGADVFSDEVGQRFLYTVPQGRSVKKKTGFVFPAKFLLRALRRRRASQKPACLCELQPLSNTLWWYSCWWRGGGHRRGVVVVVVAVVW